MSSSRQTVSLLFAALLSVVPVATTLAMPRVNEDGQQTFPVAIVIAPAPIYVRVGFATPMRVAAVGTRLNVLGSNGEWTQVQFQDPQLGLRIGWVETKLLKRPQPDLEPMDLSVPATQAVAPSPAVRGTDGASAGSPRDERTLAEPESSPARGSEGFWFSIGFGLGSLGCDDCIGRENGFSGGLALGGAINDRVLLGVGTTGFSKSVDGALLTVGTLDGRIRVYPSRTSGFFLNAGIGLGTLSFDGDAEFGLGLMLGVGWDIRVGRRVSLTPFWNGSAMRNDVVDANFGQLGLGVTIH